MMGMGNHKQAATSYDMVQDGTSTMHQDMADMYKKMISTKTEITDEGAKSFSKISEHKKVAAVHEEINNGQSSVIYQQQADKHRSQSTQN